MAGQPQRRGSVPRYYAPRHAAQPDVERFCRQVIEQLTRDSVGSIATTLAATETSPVNGNIPLTSWLLNQAVTPLTDQAGALQIQLRVPHPIIGVGAPAQTYYGAIAERLGTRAVIPPHAEVCNAVGAAASGIAERARVLITVPSEECFRAHTASGIQDFGNLENAASYALEQARLHAEQLARHAGGIDIRLSVTRADNFVDGFGGHRIFIESVIIATAVARPRHARSRSTHAAPRLTTQA